MHPIFSIRLRKIYQLYVNVNIPSRSETCTAISLNISTFVLNIYIYIQTVLIFSDRAVASIAHRCPTCAHSQLHSNCGLIATAKSDPERVFAPCHTASTRLPKGLPSPPPPPSRSERSRTLASDKKGEERRSVLFFFFFFGSFTPEQKLTQLGDMWIKGTKTRRKKNTHTPTHGHTRAFVTAVLLRETIVNRTK